MNDGLNKATTRSDFCIIYEKNKNCNTMVNKHELLNVNAINVIILNGFW